MSNRKSIRERGNISFRRYFQEFEEGERVAVIREKAVASNFPDRLQGRTGKVKSKQGKSYFVEINDNKKPKNFLIQPVHLKKILNRGKGK